MAGSAVAWFEVTGKDGPALQKFHGGHVVGLAKVAVR